MFKDFDFKAICQDVLANLTDRQAAVLTFRFGLFGEKQKTLQEIGRRFNITRERVRQIERNVLANLRKKEANKNAQGFFLEVESLIKKSGGACKESQLLKLAPKGLENEFIFLLYLNKNSQRVKESENLFAFWCLSEDIKNKIEDVVGQMLFRLQKAKKPLSKETLFAQGNSRVCFAGLDIAKQIEQGPLGGFGLVSWAEIKPKGVRDGALLALKKEGKPLHFREIAKRINGLPQTVHNELIRDEQFILVGRGIYGLKDWGYEKGTVLDIIKNALSKLKKPQAKEKILDLVLSQRLVKPSTVLLNLNNKQCFQKDVKGRYTIKEI